MEERTAASSGSQGSPAGPSPPQDDLDEAGAGGSLHFAASGEMEMCLPTANIGRIMRRALPANAKVAKETKQCVQECVTEFIGFVTSEAGDICLKEKRKAVTGDDVISAMATLGFENYAEVLKVYLGRYRELEGDSRSAAGSRSTPDPH